MNRILYVEQWKIKLLGKKLSQPKMECTRFIFKEIERVWKQKQITIENS